MFEKNLQLKRNLAAAAILPGLFALSGCQKTEATTSPTIKATTESIPTISTNRIVPFVAESCVKFAVSLEQGQTKFFNDADGADSYSATNLGETMVHGDPPRYFENTLILTHYTANGSIKSYDRDYKPMDTSYADGSASHLAVLQTGTSVEANGWVCRPA